MTSDSARDQQSFLEKMHRFFGNMENALYAAEILCQVKNRPDDWVEAFYDQNCIEDCPCKEIFSTSSRSWTRCNIAACRRILGDRVKQHDTEDDCNGRV